MVSEALKAAPGSESMTVADVAASLNVVVSTVRKWIDSQMLPAFHPPGTDVIRIFRADFEKFVANNMTTVLEPPEPPPVVQAPRDIVAEGSARQSRSVNRLASAAGNAPRRRRGRPPGSKNKPKTGSASVSK